MKLTQFRRIITEDFDKEDQNLVSKLAYIINNAFEIFNYNLNKGITIADNLNQDLVDFMVTVDANGVPKTSPLLKYNLKTSCKGIIIIQALNQTNPSIYPTNAPFISFNQTSSNLLEIKHISGLQANQKYLLKLLLIGG